MKKAIGSEVWVYLRSSANTVGDIFGLLVDVDDDSLYVQSFDTNNPIAYIIPRDNVKYCTTSALPSANLAIDPGEPKQQDVAPHIIQKAKQEEQKPDHLNIFVNKELIASIPVPPTFNLDSWNENIMRVIMGNPDMRAMLANRTQKSLEYWPGEVYIELTEEEQQVEQQPEVEEPADNSFSMSDGGQKDITTKFVNPSQMITRLNAAVTRGKKHGETKV